MGEGNIEYYIPMHGVFGGRGGIGMPRSGCWTVHGLWRHGPLRTCGSWSRRLGDCLARDWMKVVQVGGGREGRR
jgi:hypothetical protein